MRERVLIGTENTDIQDPKLRVLQSWGFGVVLAGHADWTEVTSMGANSPRGCSEQTQSLRMLTPPCRSAGGPSR